MGTNNHDPFSRRQTKKQQSIGDAIGIESDIPDKHDEDERAIKHLIPTTAASQGSDPVTAMTNIFNAMNAASHPSSPDSGIGTAIEFPDETLKDKASTDVPETPQEKPENVVNTVEADEKPKYTDEELLPILDSILTTGYASYTFYIRNTEVTLRTPFQWEDNFAISRTEATILPNTLRTTANYFYQQHTLATNLVAFGANVFTPIRTGTTTDLEKSYDTRVKFIDTLPTLIVNVLWNKRQEFMDKVDYVLKDFDRIIKVF